MPSCNVTRILAASGFLITSTVVTSETAFARTVTSPAPSWLSGMLEVFLSVYREVESHNMTLRLSAPT